MNKPIPPGTGVESVGFQNLPIEPYVSSAFFDAVKSRIFGRSWLCLGRTDLTPKVGDYVVRRVPGAEAGILIVHGRDGRIRAFHNVCPHRGSELLWDESGACSRLITCRFHGWSFGLDGRLAGVTDPHFFDGLSPGDIRLTQITMEIWRGFIFINLSPAPAESLEAFLGELGARISSYPFERFALHNRYAVTLDVNWMVAMDAFQEAYHAGFLHRQWTSASPRSKIVETILYDRHRTATFSAPGRNPPTPIQAEALKYGKSGLYASQEQETLEAVNPGKHGDFLFDCNVVFPNLFIDITSRNYWTYSFWPVDHHRTVFEVDMYDGEPANYAEALATAYSRVRLMILLLEDLSTLERNQLGLESGAISSVIVGSDEILVRHGHETVLREVAGHPVPAT